MSSQKKNSRHHDGTSGDLEPSDYSHKEVNGETSEGSTSSPIHRQDQIIAASTNSSFGNDNNIDDNEYRHDISITELVKCIGNEQRMLSTNIPPELDRRVRDFRLAQQKRLAKYGATKRNGIFGMYAHLHNVRVDLEWAEDAAWRRQHHHPYLSWTDFDDARLQSINPPWLTYFIIVCCTVMMIVEFALNEWKMAPLSVNPMLGPSAEALIKAGARQTALIVEKGQWFRLFSPLVLHAGIIHYLINMLALGFIGGAVEQSHGISNTLILFMVPGVGGNILSAIFLPKYVSVGASGGIFGLLGGCVADITLNWKLLFIKNCDEEEDHQVFRRNFWCVFWLVLEIIVNIMLGLVTPFIDNWTHLGGLIYGICCALSILPALDVAFFGVSMGTWARIQTIVVRFCGLIFTLVMILVSTIWLAESDPGVNPCPGCRYVSCVPFPFFQDEKWWYCDDCDFVSGSVSRDSQDSFVLMNLTCPDNSIELIDISEGNISDENEVMKQLPTYCRQHCEAVFNK